MYEILDHYRIPYSFSCLTIEETYDDRIVGDRKEQENGKRSNTYFWKGYECRGIKDIIMAPHFGIGLNYKMS